MMENCEYCNASIDATCILDDGECLCCGRFSGYFPENFVNNVDEVDVARTDLY